jgi:CubicO group peptidase (beta-lactamase class C family)
MGRVIAALALLAGAFASTAGFAQARPAFAAEALDKWIEALHAEHDFSGAVVIERDGAVVYARGIGMANAATSTTFTPDTPTDGASLAKPITATALLLLEDAGALDIDAPVRRYVKEYPDETTRVFELLAHRPLLPDYPAFAALIAEKKPITTLAMLQEVGRTPPPAPPAGPVRFHYCNLCLDAAALVVERVSGRSFASHLRERIFVPTGIDRAFVRPAKLAALPADRAVGYRFREGKRETFDALDNEGFHGGANIYASARDFARFARAFALPAKQTSPVPKKALWPLFPHGDLLAVLTLGQWYCTAGADRCYSTGSHRGFHNVVYFDRSQRLVVAYVSNSGVAPWLAPRITRELVVTAEGRLPAPPVEPRLATLSPEVLAGAAGTYDVPGAGRVTLLDVDGKPYVRAGGSGVEYRLHPVSPTLLYAPGLDATVGIGEDKRLSWVTALIDSYGTKR